MSDDGLRWLLLIYRVPSEPSRARVAVWRDLKRLGGLYLQQAVCLFPDRPELREALAAVRGRIDALGGTWTWIETGALPFNQNAGIVERFRQLAAHEYAEIIEECETKFVKEIEFERFRENYTFEEAEEIRQDLEKIGRWLAKVIARDWFDGPGRADAQAWLARCETLLDAFEAEVYQRTGGHDGTDIPGRPHH
jgi:hypothetical protein